MVHLVNPEPPSPKAGGKFSITADLGIPPYAFTWRINDHDAETRTQAEKVLTIDIPRDAAGDILFVKVVDAEDAQDATTFIIEGDKPNDL